MMEFKATSENTGLVISGKKAYYVWYDPYQEEWFCECPGYVFHRKYCKHIKFVKEVVEWSGGR